MLWASMYVLLMVMEKSKLFVLPEGLPRADRFCDTYNE